MSEEFVPFIVSPSHLYISPAAPTTSVEGDIWLQSYEPIKAPFPPLWTVYTPWTYGLTHRQWLNYVGKLARGYAQRTRRPQVARQRRLIEQYGEAYRWPPQYRHPIYR